MSEKQFEREKMYQTSMHIFRKMVSRGILTAEEYAMAERMMERKYRPVMGRILSSL